MAASPYLELLDWRRRMAALFTELRRRPPDAARLAWFRTEKDALFREHPQSPLPQPARHRFSGLSYWPFDPACRVQAHFRALESPPESHQSAGHDSEIAFSRIGELEFDLGAQSFVLPAFWIEGYAGGLFVPFTDATGGHETYGGGRYLLDTIKSADIGSDAATDTVELDFNYAYHPSCTYDPQWVCPLAPADSRLDIAIRAGERLL